MVELYMTPNATFAPIIINVSQFDFLSSYDPLYMFRVKRESGHYVSHDQNSGPVYLIAARPDGVVYQIKGRVTDWSDTDKASCFHFKMIKGITDVAGDVICEIVFVDDPKWSDAGQSATANFILRVEPSPKRIYKYSNTVVSDYGGDPLDGSGNQPPYEPDVPADSPPKYRLVRLAGPTKTTYTEGEALNLTGLQLLLEKYSDSDGVMEQTDVTTNCAYEPSAGTVLSTSNTKVTATYSSGNINVQLEFSIVVNRQDTNPSSFRLNVASLPNKTSYTEGDALDLTGVKINLEEYTEQDGVTVATDVTNGCNFQPANGTALTQADTSVTATYDM